MYRWLISSPSGLRVAGSASLALLLVACGSGGDGGFTPPSGTGGGGTDTLTGIFIDSPVSGLSYTTDTLTGTTDAEGSFNYLKKETITFNIGETIFPSTAAQEIITPLDLVGTTDPTNQAVVNIARLLQTLDEDGNVNNGIQIPATAADVSTPLDFTASSSEFEIASSNMVANAGGVRTALIDEDTAINQLMTALILPAISDATTLGGGTDIDNVDYLTAVSRRGDGTYIDVHNDTFGLEYDPILNSYQAAINTGTWTLTGDELCTTKNSGTECQWLSLAGDDIEIYSDISKTELVAVDTIAERWSTVKIPGRYKDSRCVTCYLELLEDRTGALEEDGIVEAITWRTDVDGNLRLETLEDAPIPGTERLYIESSTGDATYDSLDVIVYTNFEDDFAKMFESTLTRVQ